MGMKVTKAVAEAIKKAELEGRVSGLDKKSSDEEILFYMPPNPDHYETSLTIESFVPIQVVSESNTVGHWTHRHKRFKKQAASIDSAFYQIQASFQGITHLRAELDRRKEGHVTIVTFTRVGGREMDSDNIQSAFKACRDRVAFWLLKDDGDPFFIWNYAQWPGRGVKGIRIKIAFKTEFEYAREHDRKHGSEES